MKTQTTKTAARRLARYAAQARDTRPTGNVDSDQTRRDAAGYCAAALRAGWRMGVQPMIQSSLDFAARQLGLHSASFEAHLVPVREACVRLRWTLRALERMAGRR